MKTNRKSAYFMLISKKLYSFFMAEWILQFEEDEWLKFEKKRTGAADSKTERQFIVESFTQDYVLSILSASSNIRRYIKYSSHMI